MTALSTADLVVNGAGPDKNVLQIEHAKQHDGSEKLKGSQELRNEDVSQLRLPSLYPVRLVIL